ncbi:ribonuclease inhibitor [Neorhizobium huautlense]|uniref:Ribonuclease inhibitor n=1 Tax=Neorhizobium huautlense TaxID=67774 RepID=A0ABT9PRY8_9HYPH|nr:barstar family protein [Neorhizobium huautlense]MDP9836913.1 ribonuclease inhibitor [Neorhizobium huautlense]
MTATTLTIDCRGIDSTASFWERYVEVVGPENCVDFGRNLDALWDALSGGGPGWPDVEHLVYENSKALLDMPDGEAAFLLQRLSDMAARLTHMKLELA